METTELDDVLERYEARMTDLIETWEAVSKAIREMLVPAFEKLIRAVVAWLELIRREYVYWSLSRWLPNSIARWLANHLPVRLLPRIDRIFAEAIRD